MGQPEKEWNKTNTAYNSTMEENCFRFQDMQIWQRAAAFSPELFQLADQLEKQRLFRFAEQLPGAVLSITNNIAEGSGSTSRVDFANFLNTARRSTFEMANILFLLSNDQYIDQRSAAEIIPKLIMLLVRVFARSFSPCSQLLT